MVRILASASYFSLIQNVQSDSAAIPSSYTIGTGFVFPGREADHSPPTSAEDKNEWSDSTPPIRLHGMDRKNITFTLYFAFQFSLCFPLIP
jgi:hypothetical protein